MKKGYSAFTVVLSALFMLILFGADAEAKHKRTMETKSCLGCHEPMNPGITEPWEQSRHSAAGVGCYECHLADKSDADAINHNGFTISVIVSPKDCSKCHPDEVEEMTMSRHAKASRFVGSLDNVLGRVVIGEANFNLGCAQCHGTEVKVDDDGNLVAGTWPNTGIGRLNPDGTHGTCTACHQRHAFSVKQAREPKTCGKCHQGPDHPQLEIYELSKHGIAYSAYKEDMKMGSSKWVLGEEYTQAPVCVTCHMGETRMLDKTHDVGSRLSWTLRPIISTKLPDWETKREDMKAVCAECHQKSWYDGFFMQFDNLVELYNEKFARPAQDVIKFLKAEKVIDDTPFNEQVEIDFYRLWHDEGRVARHGASMNGPDYVMWHGMYEVSMNFYFNLMPNADEVVAKKGSDATKKKWKKFKAEIMNRPEHKWNAGMEKGQIDKISEWYRERYGEENEY